MNTIEPGQQTSIPDKTKVKLIGGSYMLLIPPESDAASALGCSALKQDDAPDEIEVAIRSNTGNYGEYMESWNPTKQAGDD